MTLYKINPEKLKKLIAYSVVIFINGCGTTQILESTTTEHVAYLTKPTYEKAGLNTEREIEIGKSIVSTGKKADIPSIKLDEPITIQGVDNNRKISINIPAGTLRLFAENKYGKFFKSQSSLTYKEPEYNFQDQMNGGVLIPNNPTEKASGFWLTQRGITAIKSNDIKYSNTAYEVWTTDELRRELVYSGISQNTVTLLYRELNLDKTTINYMARPAFSQEIKYDLSRSDIIGYNGARFKVLNATNTTIRVKLLQHMDE